jgi:hypothetical protein
MGVVKEVPVFGHGFVQELCSVETVAVLNMGRKFTFLFWAKIP